MKHLTYLLYILAWEGSILGGCAYLVFWRGQSGLWFILALLLSSGAYRPNEWIHGVTKDKK